MRYPAYKPKEIEPEILNFWKHHHILDKIKQKNKNGKGFYFLLGPPYTSGRIHLGHAWNHGLKDLVLRYKRMNGFNVLDRQGYDMHGLPTEHATEKKLGIQGSEQIKAYGIEKFVKECENLCITNMKQMSQDFEKLGIWMDFEDPYQSITNDFIDGEWWLIKQAHKKKRLYEGLRTMHWDLASATGVAKHELEYKSVTDKSVYLKFELREKKGTYFVVWTTTPWTIPFNLAVMVHPDLTYVTCEVAGEGEKGEKWIVEKNLSSFIKEVAHKDFKILSECKGKGLEGTKYIHPFEDEIKFPKSAKLHTVVLSNEYVDSTTGTGIVHCAPGCGPEDYEVGYRNGLPPFNTLDERGFVHDCGRFDGLIARKDDAKFTETFNDHGLVVAVKSYRHDYPHDWRSHEPVVFRTTKQWFFKVEDLKNKMIRANKKVEWVPEAGFNAFNSWLENLRDNSISKQRFWGTPLPIWRNTEDESDYIVVGSIKELEKLSKQKISNPHKPWIDEVVITKKAKGANGKVKTYKRVPDVLDVWVDAGTASWNSLYYPSRKNLFKKFFPADFILEGKDQIRGWFNLLTVASFLAIGKPSFKAVYMHGFVTDVEGVKMSKSLGNVISPDEVVSKYSADVLRYYSAQTKAGEDMNFSWDEIEQRHRNLNVLWNIHKLLISLTQENKINPFKLDSKVILNELDIEERAMLSLMHDTIKQVTGLIESYRLDEVIAPAENLYLELSRTYIQLIRDKSTVGSQQEKEVVAYIIANVLLTVLKLLSPVVPFITEAMYQNLMEEYVLDTQSVHMFEWPKPSEKSIDRELEEDMLIAKNVISTALHIREKIQVNVRWPMKEAIITTKDKNVARAMQKFEDIIKKQINVKELKVLSSLNGVKEKIRVDFGKIGPRYGELCPKIVAKLAIESQETMLGHLDKEGKYAFTLDGVDVELVPDDLLRELEVPAPYKADEFNKGVVFLNQEKNDMLEGEGYSREIVRRVQELRKKTGLQKPDRIVLYVEVSEDLASLINPFVKDVTQRVGAEKVKVGTLAPVKKHQTVSKEKVKDEEFTVYFDKI